jgi:hypothetical protein
VCNGARAPSPRVRLPRTTGRERVAQGSTRRLLRLRHARRRQRDHVTRHASIHTKKHSNVPRPRHHLPHWARPTTPPTPCAPYTRADGRRQPPAFPPLYTPRATACCWRAAGCWQGQPHLAQTRGTAPRVARQQGPPAAAPRPYARAAAAAGALTCALSCAHSHSRRAPRGRYHAGPQHAYQAAAHCQVLAASSRTPLPSPGLLHSRRQPSPCDRVRASLEEASVGAAPGPGRDALSAPPDAATGFVAARRLP